MVCKQFDLVCEKCKCFIWSSICIQPWHPKMETFFSRTKAAIWNLWLDCVISAWHKRKKESEKESFCNFVLRLLPTILLASDNTSFFNTDQRNMGLCGLKSFTKTKCVIKKCHKRSHRIECLIRLVRFLLKG